MIRLIKDLFYFSVFLFFISLGKVDEGTAPIISSDKLSAANTILYANPLPHVLILTAIVVGVSTTAVALSLIIRIFESLGTLEEDEIHRMEHNL